MQDNVLYPRFIAHIANVICHACFFHWTCPTRKHTTNETNVNKHFCNSQRISIYEEEAAENLSNVQKEIPLLFFNFALFQNKNKKLSTQRHTRWCLDLHRANVTRNKKIQELKRQRRNIILQEYHSRFDLGDFVVVTKWPNFEEILLLRHYSKTLIATRFCKGKCRLWQRCKYNKLYVICVFRISLISGTRYIEFVQRGDVGWCLTIHFPRNYLR